MVLYCAETGKFIPIEREQWTNDFQSISSKILAIKIIILWQIIINLFNVKKTIIDIKEVIK